MIKKEWYFPPSKTTPITPFDNVDLGVNKVLDCIATVTNTEKDKVQEILKAYFTYTVDPLNQKYIIKEMKTSLNNIVGYLVGEIAKEDNEFWCWAEFLGEDKENEKQRAYNHWKEAVKRHPDLNIVLVEKTIEHRIVEEAFPSTT